MAPVERELHWRRGPALAGADTDGDGRDEILGSQPLIRMRSLVSRLGRFSMFAEESFTYQERTPIQDVMVDVNGDGRLDIVGLGQNQDRPWLEVLL